MQPHPKKPSAEGLNRSVLIRPLGMRPTGSQRLPTSLVVVRDSALLFPCHPFLLRLRRRTLTVTFLLESYGRDIIRPPGQMTKVPDPA